MDGAGAPDRVGTSFRGWRMKLVSIDASAVDHAAELVECEQVGGTALLQF